MSSSTSDNKSFSNYMKEAFKKHPHTKTTKVLIDVEDIQCNAKTSVRQYEDDQRKVNANYEKIHDETEHIRQTYKGFIKKRNKGHYLEMTFKDLITRYKTKGYEIPDLSTKRNIFKENPLLIENNHLAQYFEAKAIEGQRIKGKGKQGRKEMISEILVKAGDKSQRFLRKLKRNVEKVQRINEGLNYQAKTIDYDNNYQEEVIETRFFDEDKEDNVIEEIKEEEAKKEVIVPSPVKINLRKENQRLIKEIAQLKNETKIAQEIPSTPGVTPRSKRNAQPNFNDQANVTTMSFHTTQYTTFGTDYKKKQPIQHIPSIKPTSLSKSKYANSASKPKPIPSSHSRNTRPSFNYPQPLTTDQLQEDLSQSGYQTFRRPHTRAQLDFSLSKEEFLKKASNYNYENLTLEHYEDIMSEYSRKYWGYTDDNVKKLLTRHKEPNALLKTIDRYQTKIKKYDLKSNYPNKNKKAIPLIDRVKTLDAYSMKLDKTLGKNLVNICNI